MVGTENCTVNETSDKNEHNGKSAREIASYRTQATMWSAVEQTTSTCWWTALNVHVTWDLNSKNWRRRCKWRYEKLWII